LWAELWLGSWVAVFGAGAVLRGGAFFTVFRLVRVGLRVGVRGDCVGQCWFGPVWEVGLLGRV